MLSDNINREYERLLKEKEDKEKQMGDNMDMKFRGELEIWALKDGKVIHHEKDHNVVTSWAKHATMHMMSGESYTTHGNRDIDGFTSFSRRSVLPADHTINTTNADGTVISGEKFLSDNPTEKYNNYWSIPNPTHIPNLGAGDSNDGFVYPFFPTKMLFGTGIEYESWAEVVADGRSSGDQDGYGNPGNGGWDEASFNEKLITNIDISNYYSATWDVPGLQLKKTRTVNDVFSGALEDSVSPMLEDNFGVKGAVKNGTYTDVSQTERIAPDSDGKYFNTGSYRGIGTPAFIYPTNESRFFSGGDIVLDLGTSVGTEHLESKITYTVEMPEQSNGEFYPYNGHWLKVAGLFADAGMLLGNDIPADNNNDNDDINGLELTNYKKMPSGLLWATRNIAPIYKGHDTSIIARWTIYM